MNGMVWAHPVQKSWNDVEYYKCFDVLQRGTR